MQQTFAVLEKGKIMADYIKREDALEQFDYYDLGEYLTTQIRGMLMDIPSADVAPVRQGRWNADRSYIGWVCSECCYAISDRHLKQNYCPNCGAKMDE